MDFHIPEAVIGAILASLIAGLLTLIGLIISKEQKVSEFRQNWIDALRNEVAMFISHANAIQGAYYKLDGTEAPVTWEAVRRHYFGINNSETLIRLRLNSKEKEAKEIISAIELFPPELSKKDKIDISQLTKLKFQLVERTNKVLSNEWKRVKKGERFFHAAKISSLIFVIVAVLTIIASGVLAIYA